MIEAFLSMILKIILDYLLGKATTAVAKELDQMAEDKKRGKINDNNVKAYQDAKDRQSRVRAATDLLNGNP